MRNVIESSKGKEPATTPSRSPAPFQGARSLKSIRNNGNMEKFKFNENCVCTNPNVLRREDRQCSFEIDTAIGRYERWVYGCRCILIGTGFGSPCMDKAQYPIPSYQTEQDAIKAACKEIRKFLTKNKTGSDPNKANKTVKLYDKKHVSLLDKIERPQPKELSLFDFDYCDRNT